MIKKIGKFKKRACLPAGKGFTFIELLVVLSVLIILISIAVPSLRVFQRDSDTAQTAEEIINVLRLAQSRTLASEGASQYGVYFDTSTLPHRYVLFKGLNYASRATSSDVMKKMSDSVEIFNVNAWGGNEVVFERITGHTLFASTAEILVGSPDSSTTIYIENSGLISTNPPSLISDSSRQTDSRHIHFSYNREINTTTEKIVLKNFSTIVQEIPVNTSIADGQFFWEGEVSIDGQNQMIKIHTHRLNSPDTQFSVHRDRRYNNKALTIEISGDASGSLIDYSAQGDETRGTSVNLTIGQDGSPQRQ